MIIIEGPDGAGKTTLCQKIAEDFGLEICDWKAEMGLSRDEMKIHPVRRYYHALSEEFRMTVDQTALENPLIHDRLYFSSLVYGPILEGTIQMSEEDRRTIARILIALACPIILCLPPKEVVLKNVHGGDYQMEGVKEHTEDIYDLYPKVVRGDAYPFVMYYDYTDTIEAANYWTYDLLKARISMYLERRAQRGLKIDGLESSAV